MKPSPVVYRNFVIRGQMTYSHVVGEIIVRCILEIPATGQRQGFTDVEALLVSLRAELIELQRRMIPPDQKGGKS